MFQFTGLFIILAILGIFKFYLLNGRTRPSHHPAARGLGRRQAAGVDRAGAADAASAAASDGHWAAAAAGVGGDGALRQLPVVVQPLLGHLRDEERRLGDLLLRHQQPRVGDAHVEVRPQDGVLAAGLGAAQKVDGERFPVVALMGKFKHVLSNLKMYQVIELNGPKKRSSR